MASTNITIKNMAMHKKQLILIPVLSFILAYALLLLTDGSQLYSFDRHVEIAIQNCGSGNSVDIIDYLYDGVSVPLDYISAAEDWTHEEHLLSSDGSAESFSYISLTGQGSCQLVFQAGPSTGTVQFYIDGQPYETILLSEQPDSSYTWTYTIAPILHYQSLLPVFFSLFLLLAVLFTVICCFQNHIAQLDNTRAATARKNYRRMWHFHILTSVFAIAAALFRRLNGEFYKEKIDYLLISFLFLLMLFLVSHFLWWGGRVLSRLLSLSHKKMVIRITCVLFPFLAFAYMEWMLGYSVLSMNPQALFLNLCCFYLLFGLFFVLFSRPASCIRGILLVSFGIGIANYFVFSFRDRPIIPSDLYVVALALDVAQNFSFQISDHIYFAVLLLCILLSLLFLLPETEYPRQTVRDILVKKCIPWAAAFSVGLFCFFHMDFAVFMNMPLSWWSAEDNYAENGFLASFLAYAQAMSIETPENYSAAAAKELLSEYPAAAAERDEKPNIIVIMNEAWTDFSSVGDAETNIDYLDFYHSLTENTVKGNLYVSIWGGNTSNTEYEFLTGNSMSFFPYGSVPYQQYVTHATDNFTSTLKAAGYTASAIHPYGSSGYNRSRVYPFFGFENLSFIEDFENPNYVRWCIDDQTSFEKIEEIYEENKDNGPEFIFNVTMQNHGGFGEYVRDGCFTPTVFLQDSVDFDDTDIQEYLSLITLTDEALEELISYFSNVEEDTVIVMFGDHQPGLSEESTDYLVPLANDSLEEQQKRYQVPYFIWANFDIPEQEDLSISANYLSAYLLELLDLDRTSYDQFLLKLQEQIPVMNIFGYQTADGSWYAYGEGPDNYESWLQNYRYLQYYRIFSK